MYGIRNVVGAVFFEPPMSRGIPNVKPGLDESPLRLGIHGLLLQFIVELRGFMIWIYAILPCESSKGVLQHNPHENSGRIFVGLAIQFSRLFEN